MSIKTPEIAMFVIAALLALSGLRGKNDDKPPNPVPGGLAQIGHDMGVDYTTQAAKVLDKLAADYAALGDGGIDEQIPVRMTAAVEASLAPLTDALESARERKEVPQALKELATGLRGVK